MRKCPDCGKWTLGFDEYFSRFRCHNPECDWMPTSTAEREIRLLQNHKHLNPIEQVLIDELGLTVSFSYDDENDAITVDFGLDEPSYDLPEADGRMIWRVSHQSGSVSGFTILGAKKLGISGLKVDIIVSRLHDIERHLKRHPPALFPGRATRVLIDNVVVTAQSEEPPQQEARTDPRASVLERGFGSLQDTMSV